VPQGRYSQLIGWNTSAVVRHFNQAPARFFNLNADRCPTGIQSVFKQLFNDGGRPFNDFAGSNLGCDFAG
jgi:hypothetical protein